MYKCKISFNVTHKLQVNTWAICQGTQTNLCPIHNFARTKAVYAPLMIKTCVIIFALKKKKSAMTWIWTMVSMGTIQRTNHYVITAGDWHVSACENVLSSLMSPLGLTPPILGVKPSENHESYGNHNKTQLTYNNIAIRLVTLVLIWLLS